MTCPQWSPWSSPSRGGSTAWVGWTGQDRDDTLNRAVARLIDALLRALTADLPFDAAWRDARATCVRSVAAVDREVTARVLLETEADWKGHYEAARDRVDAGS